MTRRGETHRLWSDDDIGQLQDLAHLTARQAGEVLGKSKAAIKTMRLRLRRGYAPAKASMTDDEIDFIRHTPHFTAQQIAQTLGKSYGLVVKTRRELGKDGFDFGTGGATTKSPFAHGRRKVLAKTCPGCGLLLDGAFFAEHHRSSYNTLCTRCRHEREDKLKAGLYRGKSAGRLQSLSLTSAENHRSEWTEADHNVLADPDLTPIEKALRLHRTYHATSTALSRFGYTSNRSLGDPLDGQWRIDNPAEAS